MKPSRNEDTHFPKCFHELFYSLPHAPLYPTHELLFTTTYQFDFFYHYISVDLHVHGSYIMSSFIFDFFHSAFIFGFIDVAVCINSLFLFIDK